MFRITNDKHVIVAGNTGTGKTFLSRRLLKDVQRLVVFDGKGTLDNWNTEEWNKQSVRRLLEGEPVRVRIKTPIGSVNEILDEMDEYFKTIYTAGNVIVYLDEVFSVANANNSPPFLTALYTRGREFRIGVWTACQRVYNIPLFAFSQSDFFIVFRMNMQEDLKRLSTVMGDEVQRIRPKGHDFIFYQNGRDNIVYFRQGKGRQ